MALRWRKVQACPDVPGCDCPEPSSPPAFVGQTANTDCGQSSSSPRSSSSSSGSPSSPSSGECLVGTPPQPCTGTCTWTTNNPYAGALKWVQQSSGCSPDGYPCLCEFPSRPPEFVGDTTTSNCGCCQGCQWIWNPYPFEYWSKDPDSDFCHPAAVDCGGDCPAPTHHPGYDQIIPSVITACGGTVPSVGSSAAASSPSSF
jgi:hypothetical protein